MKTKLDILLVNSIARRQRIASDAALENGLAILRTYLENNGCAVEVVDDQRITAVENGVPQWCLKLLRHMVNMQTKIYNRRQKLLWFIVMLLTWPIQALSLHYRDVYTRSRIEDIINIIREKNIDFLGVKIWYGEAFTWSKLLASRVRETCPNTVIIAGGPHVKVYGEELLSNSKFDLAIMGPGEQVLEEMIELRKTVKNRQEFLAAYQSKNGGTKLIKAGIYNENAVADDIPFTTPNYRTADLQGKIYFHTLVDGYGCSWNRCSFCSHTRQIKPYYSRSAEDIAEEIQALSRQGISFFRFSSSETPYWHGKKIAEEILKKGLNINFSMFARAVKVTPKVFEAYRTMIRAGLRAIFIGGETGHDYINETVMNKGVKRKDLIDTINCIKLASLDVGQNCKIGLSLIYPCPVTENVTLNDVFRENIYLINHANPDTVIVNPPGVFPKTKWMENAHEYGFSIDPDFVAKFMEYEYSIYKPTELWKDLGYSLQGMTSSDLLKETSRLRNEILSMGIPTDISDEYLMMTQAIGYTTRQDLLKFKSRSLQDIISGSSQYISSIMEKINKQSRHMAAESQAIEACAWLKDRCGIS